MALTKLNNNSLHAITDGSALKNATGMVLQVKSTDNSLTHSPANNGPANVADTGVTAIDMTRTVSGSKFLIELNGGRWIITGNSSGYYTFFYVKEGTGSYAAATGGNAGTNANAFHYNTSGGQETQGTHSASYLYTPTSSTADCSFKVYAARYNATNPGYWNITDSAGARLNFTVTEIAG